MAEGTRAAVEESTTSEAVGAVESVHEAVVRGSRAARSRTRVTATVFYVYAARASVEVQTRAKAQPRVMRRT